MIKAPMRGVAVALLEDEDTEDEFGHVLSIPNSFHQHQISITGSAGVMSGAVTIESAPTPDYAGTWNPITSAINVEDDETVQYNFSGVFAAVRTRISTVLGGGTVSTQYLGS